jgi:hypothetical protein
MLRPYLLSATSLLVLVPFVNAQSPEGAKPHSTSAAAPAQVVSDTSLPCGDCAVDRHGPWSQVWASFGYTRWTMRDAPYAYPLASTSVGVSNNPGAVGDPNTVILFGDQPLDLGWFNGLRIDGGIWFNDCHTTGVGFGLTSFGSKTFNTLFDSNTTGPAFITRPIYDAQTPGPVGLIVSDPEANISGSLGIQNKAQFYGFDLHVRQNFLNNETWTIDGTLGFRYFNLAEQLLITQRTNYDATDGNSPLVVGQISYDPPGSGPTFDPISHILNNQVVTQTSVNSLLITDSFETRNQIYGVQLGTRAEARWGTFYTSFAGKVTLGVNEERIDVNGTTTGITANGGTVTEQGGVLAVRGIAPVPVPFTNTPVPVGITGVQRYNQFVIMPEFSFQVGMQVTSHVRLFAGYDWLYINDVVRPGNQIDPVINQRYVPASPAYGTLAGPNKPSYPMNHTDFVAQGFSVGLEFQY